VRDQVSHPYKTTGKIIAQMKCNDWGMPSLEDNSDTAAHTYHN